MIHRLRCQESGAMGISEDTRAATFGHDSAGSSNKRMAIATRDGNASADSVDRSVASWNHEGHEFCESSQRKKKSLRSSSTVSARKKSP